MKILFPSIFYLPQVVGGIEYYTHHLAKGLLQKGYDVKVVVPAYDDESLDSYVYDGVPVIRYASFAAEGKFEIAGLQPNQSLFNFKKVLAQEKPDLVHFSQLTNSSGISLLHIEAAKEVGAKVSYTNHMSEFICQRGDFRYMGNAACDGLVTVKKCSACLMNKRGIGNATASFMMLADKVITAFTGNDNFRLQLMPVALPGFSSRWHIHKVKSITGNTDAFVSIASWSTELLKKNNWYTGKCTTIKTGLFEQKNFSRVLPAYDGKRALKIIYLGRIVPAKAPEVLINAVKEMHPQQVELHIYGPKGQKGYATHFDYCTELAKNNSNIFFHPQVNNNNVLQLIADHDILCIPSTGNEMAPLVIQEAMAANVPVIGSALPAIKEWVNDGINGFTFPVGDSIALRNKLQQLISNPALLDDFRKRLPQPGSFADVINQYESLFQSLFTGNQLKIAG